MAQVPYHSLIYHILIHDFDSTIFINAKYKIGN